VAVFELILAMVAVLASWAALVAVLAGLGLGLRRLLGLRDLDADGCLASFWLGLAFVVAWLQLWHLWLAITPTALAALSLLGVCGLVWNCPALWRYLRRTLSGRKAQLIAMAVLAVWLANRATGPCRTFDTGLYHVNGVRWAREHPIVPGLGNLHGRLAFNNANLLVSAALEVGPWYRRSNHLANGLIMLGLFAQCVLASRRMLDRDHARRTAAAFDVLLTTAAVLLAVHSWISSHATDLPVAAVTFVAASRLFRWMLGVDPRPRERSFDVVFIVAMLSLSVCLKVSVAVFALAGCVVIGALWLVEARREGRPVMPTLLAAATAAILLIGPWMARGVILSGYPAFPLTLGAVNVDWRVPEGLARQHRLVIGSFARQTSGVGGGWGWIGPWLRRADRELILPVALTALSGVAVAILGRRKSRPPGRDPRPWLILLPPLAGLAYWFFTAPAVRFGFFSLWILAAGAAALAFGALAAGASRRRLATVLVCGLLLAACNVKKGFLGPGADHGFHPSQTEKMTTYVTRFGLLLHVPVKPNKPCWDAPLPCTPYPKPYLRLRRKGDLRSGFVLDPPQPQQYVTNRVTG